MWATGGQLGLTPPRDRAKVHQGNFLRKREGVSGHLATAKPCRIKASHRRRRRGAAGQSVFRDYESATGRYVQSDPVGLKGAINTYTYASSSPLTFLDFAGLAHTTGFSNSNLDRAAQNALAEAREKIRKCKMEECYDGLEAYYMTEEDRRYIMEKLITMTVVYNPTLRECGYAPQFQSEYVEIGPLSFHPSCCLAGTLAHEASHLGRNWGNGRGSEERSEYIEEKCFGCTGGWR